MAHPQSTEMRDGNQARRGSMQTCRLGDGGEMNSTNARPQKQVYREPHHGKERSPVDPLGTSSHAKNAKKCKIQHHRLQQRGDLPRIIRSRHCAVRPHHLRTQETMHASASAHDVVRSWRCTTPAPRRRELIKLSGTGGGRQLRRGR